MDCSSASSSKFWAKKVRAELGNSVLFDHKKSTSSCALLYSHALFVRFTRALFSSALLARFTCTLYSPALLARILISKEMHIA